MRALVRTLLLLAACAGLAWAAGTHYVGPVESTNGFTVNGVPVCLSDGTNCAFASTTTTSAAPTTTSTSTTTTSSTTTTT